MTLDDAFDALASQRRRQVLVALLEHNPQPDGASVAVPGETSDEAEGDLHRRTVMHHNHLPKLDSQGFVRWNRDTHEVTKGPRFEEIRPLLELLDDHADELPADWP